MIIIIISQYRYIIKVNMYSSKAYSLMTEDGLTVDICFKKKKSRRRMIKLEFF